MVRAVLSLFLLVTKRLYGKEWEWSIVQIKTCRKKQHVRIDDRKEMSDLICGKAAVGGNYNSTRDNIHKRKRIYYFNGKWCNKYLAEKIKVFYEDDFPYVVIDGKRIYFPKNRSEDSVVDEMRRLLLEQDKESPHCYLSSNFQVKEGDVVFDCGTAEGNFAISVVNKAKKVVLFECEDEWIECLNKTFKDYKDKVIIQKKFVSNFTDDKNISIIDFSKKENLYPDFIKMDIEGAEIDAVDRIDEIIKEKPNLKMAICTYHREDDYDNLLKKLSGTFDIETSKGYMLLRDKKENPYFARGLIRCTGKK